MAIAIALTAQGKGKRDPTFIFEFRPNTKARTMQSLLRRIIRRQPHQRGRIWRVANDGVHVELDRSDGQLEIVTVHRDKVSVRRPWLLQRRKPGHEPLTEGLAVKVVTDRTGQFEIKTSN